MTDATQSLFPLRCFVCGKEVKRLFSDHIQPDEGVTFRSMGNCNSRVFDMGFAADRQVCATVCDACLAERADRLVVQTPVRQKPTHTFATLGGVDDLRNLE